MNAAALLQPVIKLEKIERTFLLDTVEVHALRGVDLVIRQGEFVAIMGSSGSGKSTLMNILGCLDQPTAGHYLLDGIDVARLSEPQLAEIRSAQIGFVFQNFNLLSRTTALENVMLPLTYGAAAALDKPARLTKARAVLARLGLSERERSMPNQLSGGQQQRVALARALINNPSILLADEPTGNLDTKTSHEIMDVIRKLNRDEGVTVIVVTHESDIAAYADRTLVMRDGLIVTDQKNPPTAGATPPPTAPRTATPSALPGANANVSWSFVGMIAATAIQALGRNKMRSMLTMLGVFIGVAALIAMVAVGDGASASVKKQLERLGSNMVVVQPGAQTAGGARGGSGSASSLTVADAEALQKLGGSIGNVSYLTRQSGQVQYRDQNWTTSIQGVTPGYIDILNWRIAAGRTFTAVDDAGAATVCLLGDTVARSLFGDASTAVGATVMVKGVAMRVIGLLESRGQTGFGQDQDDIVMIPFHTAENRVLGVASPQSGQNMVSVAYPPPPNVFGIAPRITGYVNSIYVQATTASEIDAAISEINAALTSRHHIQPGQPADFSVRNLSQIAETQQSSSQTMAVLLALVASISLLVGGVGIMNILLVSVTERTREIGIRLAIGARRLQVLLQFLVEAILLSVIGGTAGVLAGILVSWLISALAGWPTQLSIAAIIGGFAFSAAVGIFFGYYPARKAARLNPIEALHFE